MKKGILRVKIRINYEICIVSLDRICSERISDDVGKIGPLSIKKVYPIELRHGRKVGCPCVLQRASNDSHPAILAFPSSTPEDGHELTYFDLVVEYVLHSSTRGERVHHYDRKYQISHNCDFIYDIISESTKIYIIFQ